MHKLKYKAIRINKLAGENVWTEFSECGTGAYGTIQKSPFLNFV
jgi:hypothetical protein